MVEGGFFYKRMAIQAAMRRIQAAMINHRGGHGWKRKKKSLNRFKGKEKNFADTVIHLYSSKLIRLCKKHHVGALILATVLEDETDGNEKVDTDETKRLIFRNWGYASFINKISYKAVKAGIEVITE